MSGHGDVHGCVGPGRAVWCCTLSVVAVGESGVETALRAPWDYVLDGGQLYSTFTVLETWAFESLVPQPEPSPTYRAWDVLQRKANGCWGGNSWSKVTLTLSWVGWGLVRTGAE